MKKLQLLASAGIAALGLAFPAIAQESMGAQPVAANESGEGGDIVVTGSRLSSDAPTGSALISVGRADIERSNAITTSQLFLNLPLVNNLGVTQNSRQGNGGSANYTYSQGLNIHGVGPYATLMLIDGERVVPQGAYGLIVSDTSLVPTIALERLEVVPDGASAVYGSDAIAGVANLILRRRFTGLEVSASYGGADSYNQYQASAIYGHAWGSGRATLTYAYSGNSALKAIDRPDLRSDLRGRGGSDFRATQCNPGNILVGGVNYAIPAGGVTPGTASALPPGTSSRCDNFLGSYLIPDIERHNVVATLDQEVTSGLSLKATGLYARRRVLMRTGIPTTTLSVPATNAYFVRPAGTTGAETIGYAFNELSDAPAGEGLAEVFQGTVGASLKLPQQWKASLDFTYGGSNDRFLQTHLVNNAALAAALASGNPATAFNPYGAPNSPAVLAAIGNGQSSYIGRGRQSIIDFSLTGDLIALPGGPVSIALGYQRQYNEQRAFNLAGSTATPIRNIQVDSSRHVDSAYAEMLLPLIGADAGIPLVNKITIDAAVRYDRYSDVGSTTNPKVGLDWEVVQGLRLHGSYSTSFRAPSLYHAHGNGNSFVTSLSDPLLGGASVLALETVGGNATRPETARTYSFGFDLKPAAISGLSAQLSYFNIRYDNVIAALSNNAQLLNQSYYANLNIITRNPTQAQVAALLAAFPLVSGTVPANVPVIIDTRARNLGSVHTSGLDYAINYQRSIGTIGDVTVGSSGTWFLNYTSAAAPGAPFTDLLGTILNPARYQLRGYVGWRLSGIDALATLNNTDSYLNNLARPAQKVKSYTTLDLHVGYDLSKIVSLSKLRIGVDVTNLFDRKPPFVNIGPSTTTEGGYDGTQANPIGRIVAVTLGAKF
jgi:iron complex outermembrane receptor protein